MKVRMFSHLFFKKREKLFFFLDINFLKVKLFSLQFDSTPVQKTAA